MQKLQDQMDAELIRIPYFSQTSDSSFVYMFPSLNIAFNKELGKKPGKTGYSIRCAGLYELGTGTKTDCRWKWCDFV